jgi:hypothetical protein
MCLFYADEWEKLRNVKYFWQIIYYEHDRKDAKVALLNALQMSLSQYIFLEEQDELKRQS